MTDIIVIDNYDSFTWNIVEYISAVTDRTIDVYRNDKITIEKLDELKPNLLVISPGPGHPETDAGISSDCISHFAGKIPILGVCMGQQCMFTVFGGKVEQTGEILHGKTSLVEHDGRGIYQGVPQNIPVTRYHSLAGTKMTLPDCLEVTCKTQGGIIMGVRHKKYTIEGVQFHPESILSEGGKLMFENFLKLNAGTWAESVEKKKSILETIYEQRLIDVAQAKLVPGATEADLKIMLRHAPPQIDFVKRIRQSTPAVMAEIKRASPSKGDIDIKANAAQQAGLYARGGASVISVLTEPKWFKGSLNDLRAARDAIAYMPNRPALLRKDFIIDRYQIDEARVYGADTVLLIVAMLSQDVLEELYCYAKSLGMEPLVEVNNVEEMAVATALGAKVIGVNNRNLHDFVVDLDTTSRLAAQSGDDVILCALSGITGRRDVEKYVSEGVRAVLVGEALMRAENKERFIDELLGKTRSETQSNTLVKICGTRTIDGAKAAAAAGADMIGLIFAKNRRRTVTIEQAKEIASIERTIRPVEYSNDWFEYQSAIIRSRSPAIVGVFQNQSLSEILYAKAAVPLDVIQLHGEEPAEWAQLIPGPVLRAFDTSEFGMLQTGLHSLPLLDATTAGVKGGTGAQVDWQRARSIDCPFILAGGLTPENVKEAISATGCYGVDVSSGVESDGEQDLTKIRDFVVNAKFA